MKKILLIGFLFSLGACTPLMHSPSGRTNFQPLIISTARILTPLPTSTTLPTVSPVPTVLADVSLLTPTSAADLCLQLSAPGDGEVILKKNRLQLLWKSHPRAKYYIVLFRHSDGTEERIPAYRAALDLNLKGATSDASYRWHVLAYDSNDQLLCDSQVRSFMILTPTRTPPLP